MAYFPTYEKCANKAETSLKLFQAVSVFLMSGCADV